MSTAKNIPSTEMTFKQRLKYLISTEGKESPYQFFPLFRGRLQGLDGKYIHVYFNDFCSICIEGPCEDLDDFQPGDYEILQHRYDEVSIHVNFNVPGCEVFVPDLKLIPNSFTNQEDKDLLMYCTCMDNNDEIYQKAIDPKTALNSYVDGPIYDAAASLYAINSIVLRHYTWYVPVTNRFYWQLKDLNMFPTESWVDEDTWRFNLVFENNYWKINISGIADDEREFFSCGNFPDRDSTLKIEYVPKDEKFDFDIGTIKISLRDEERVTSLDVDDIVNSNPLNLGKVTEADAIKFLCCFSISLAITSLFPGYGVDFPDIGYGNFPDKI